MTFEDFKNTVRQSITDRFNVQEQTDISLQLEEFAPAELTKSLWRIQRKATTDDSSHWKTLLLVCLQEENQLHFALEWTALVKESLIDPETADLYLFIYYTASCQPLLQTCLRIESTEEFCRKYVLRPSEDTTHFIERTFFAQHGETSDQSQINDPVLKAFSSLEEKHKWFDETEQLKWRNALLSGLSGSDLIDNIFYDKKD